jgi:hypothetical protein
MNPNKDNTAIFAAGITVPCKMAQPMSTLQLHFQCDNLKQLDAGSKSDPGTSSQAPNVFSISWSVAVVVALLAGDDGRFKEVSFKQLSLYNLSNFYRDADWKNGACQQRFNRQLCNHHRGCLLLRETSTHQVLGVSLVYLHSREHARASMAYMKSQ